MDGFGREVLLKRKFIFLPRGKLQRDSEPRICFLVSWANQVTRKTGFLSSSCPQVMGIPTVHQKGR